MKRKLFSIAFLAITQLFFAQEGTVINVRLPTAQKYVFTPVIDIEASNVKSQGYTGTCWSFSTTSFIESEIYKNIGKNIDISEMYTVRNTYPIKAWDYVMRQGKTQFGEGGLAHDVLNSIRIYGLVPQSAFSGLVNGETNYNHSKIVPELKKVLDAYIKNDKHSKHPNWKKEVDSILNVTIGKIPEKFMYDGVYYTPKTFLKMTHINPDDYVTLTSFMQQPFYTKFILNIPDNFANGSFYNLPLNELVTTVDNALKNGYTLAIDCDVSEKTFSQKYGVAIEPKKLDDDKKAMTYIVTEKEITPEYRQQEFENYDTTDDHLMQIVGMVKDQNNNEYYKIKNSWGTTGDRIGNGGYVYMSKPYFKLKTISVLVNKKGLNKTIKEELKIK
ncbi:C1 family peptidase [Lutibacter sp.]|uniref:C1 family peptidase n=1 Tax=Lutibacter sp. TaxID=1925666 RepID=UPI0025BD9ABF|nr:C1 family peptidase [Lutibacter sp.]MCF6182862.1 C1 family peptidase [Lutibacter sp.]